MPTIEPQATTATAEQAPERRGLILALVCLAQFMVILDISIVNVALPSIRHDLHFDVTGLQWVVNAYTLAFAGLLLLGGRAADLFGQRKIFLLGTALFGTASLIGGFADQRGLLIAARSIQGFGGAVLSPATLTILTTTFTGHRERARAMGIWSAVAGAGGAAGALMGGLLTDLVSWRWIFFINVPIAVVAFVVAQRLLHARNARNATKLDAAGAAIVTSGLVAIVYAIVSTEQYGWTSGRIIGAGAVGIALLAWFVFHEGKLASEPLMPISLWKIPSLATANLTMFLISSGMFATWFFLSLDMQNVRGYSPLSAGLAFLPQTFAIIVGAQISSRLLPRIGARLLTLAATSVATLGLFWLSRISGDTPYVTGIFVPSVLVTFGLGLAMTPIVSSAMSGVRPQQAGLASGLINTSRQVGGAVGLALLTTFSTDRTNSLTATSTAHFALHAGYERGFFLGGFLMLAATASALFLPTPPRANRQSEQEVVVRHEFAGEV